MDLLYTFIFQTTKMSNILSYSSLTIVPIKIESKFGGSSKYRVIDDELITTVRVKKDAKPIKQEHNTDVSNFDSQACTDDEYLVNIGFEPVISESEIKTGYKLRKSKIKRKCFALSRLEKSKKFLAFYSISFPVGLSDDDAYKVFNVWLTRCRKIGGLNTYLWVAERQKNGTIHFHLLTNDHMQIRDVNGFMAIALATAKQKGVEALQSINPEKYNGVDVKMVKGTRLFLVPFTILTSTPLYFSGLILCNASTPFCFAVASAIAINPFTSLICIWSLVKRWKCIVPFFCRSATHR